MKKCIVEIEDMLSCTFGLQQWLQIQEGLQVLFVLSLSDLSYFPADSYIVSI